MKTFSTLILGVLLSVCLTLYGPLGMARAGGGAVLSVEICADGVAKTVLFDADSNPVEPSANCPECLTCCQATESIGPVNCSANPSVVIVEIVLDHLPAQNPILNKRHIYPAPRGPPAVQVSLVIKTGLILADHPVNSQNMRSDGRLLFKDAFA